MKSEQVRAEVARRGFIVRKEFPELASGVDWLLRKGALVAVLPGIYAAANLTGALLAAAIAAWNPNAVLVGQAAAALHFGQPWPETIEVVAAAYQPSNPAVRLRRAQRLDASSTATPPTEAESPKPPRRPARHDVGRHPVRAQEPP